MRFVFCSLIILSFSFSFFILSFFIFFVLALSHLPWCVLSYDAKTSAVRPVLARLVWGAVGSRSTANPHKGHKQTLVQGHNLGPLDEAGSRGA